MAPLEVAYNAFIQCLNEQRWGDLGLFLDLEFAKNNEKLTPETYAAKMQSAGDLKFEICVVVVDEENQMLASTLLIRWKPSGPVMGIQPPPEKTITFVEKYINWFSQGKLTRMVDLPDREAIYRQLSNLEALYTPDLDIATWSSKDAASGTLLRSRPQQLNLESIYRPYIHCINKRTTQAELPAFVHPHVVFNGASMTIDAYGDALRGIASAIPDLVVDIQAIVIDEEAQRVAVRLESTGTPTQPLLGIDPADGKGRFYEHGTYQFRDGKIAFVWSVGSWGSYLQAVPKSSIGDTIW